MRISDWSSDVCSSDLDQADGKPERALAAARESGRYEDEGWRVRKDGSRFWAAALIDAVHDDTGALIGVAKVTRDITAQRPAQPAMEEASGQPLPSQNLEALGRHTGRPTHAFKNPPN